MNTNVLIPKNLKIKVRTWNDLVFLGKENLIAIRAIWRSRESELGERIKWLQKTADFLAGGPNNVEAMTIVEKRKDRADFDCLGLFRGKKGSTTFANCGGCKYGTFFEKEFFSLDTIPYSNIVDVVHCSLMARIFHRAKYNWFFQGSPCPFFYDCKDGNKRIVASLNREKNEVIKEKRKVTEQIIAKLTKAISIAESKPIFPSLRNKDYFHPEDKAIAFVVRDGHYSPIVVKISKVSDDKITYIDNRIRDWTKTVTVSGPQIVSSDDYRYLTRDYAFSKIWVYSIEERWARESLRQVLKV